MYVHVYTRYIYASTYVDWTLSYLYIYAHILTYIYTHITEWNQNWTRNDCVDVSYGQYNLNKLNLNNCEDKSLSVGENSTVYLDKLYSKDSNVGIASKDSSKTFANNLNFNNLNTCLSAYNKKQEFLGGIIEVKNLRCVNFIKKLEVDKQSLINLINEL